MRIHRVPADHRDPDHKAEHDKEDYNEYDQMDRIMQPRKLVGIILFQYPVLRECFHSFRHVEALLR